MLTLDEIKNNESKVSILLSPPFLYFDYTIYKAINVSLLSS